MYRNIDFVIDSIWPARLCLDARLEFKKAHDVTYVSTQ